MGHSVMHPDRHPLIGGDRLLLLGAGDRAVVFLHGLFGTPEHWRSVMTSLADDYRLVAPQLPLDRRPGQRADGIKSLLVDGRVGLIACTSHARRGLARTVLGSVTASIVHSSPVPVLVAPVATTEDEATAEAASRTAGSAA